MLNITLGKKKSITVLLILDFNALNTMQENKKSDFFKKKQLLRIQTDIRVLR